MTETATRAEDIEAGAAHGVVTAWLADFGRSLEAGDIDTAAEMFLEDSFWRDLVAFTWNIVTVEGPAGVRDMLGATLAAVRPTVFAVADELGPPSSAGGVTEGWLRFETATGRGVGHVRLRDGKAWTLLTTLQELRGYEEPVNETRIKGVEHGANPDRRTWLEGREAEMETLGYSTQPYTVIVGGGQGGIALGARMRQLGIPTIIVERNARPGDSWRNRYKSLCLHDPVWYDHLPYLDFPENWPIFSPKDKMGDWLEMYAKVMELNYWTSTECKRASFDDVSKEWAVVVERDGVEVTLRPKQLVIATGASGKPNIPSFPGMESFAGEQHHSSKHSASDGYCGKKAVIIGANNSAHDICVALWEAGADVTMVQHSSTLVVKSETALASVAELYSERAIASGITTHKADLILASLPYRIMPEAHIPIWDEIKKRDAELYERLSAAGFMLDFGKDGSGLWLKYLQRGSGYYIDVGGSELVARGDIKLESNVEVARLTEDSVVLSNGTELKADLVVYATGYGPMNGWVADLISMEVAEKIGRVWGLGCGTEKDPDPWEGELRNMWKPTQQAALWMHGGNLYQSRQYSLYLALQIKARMEGIPTPVYGLQEVHHIR